MMEDRLDGRRDLASAIADLTERLPEELQPLGRLTYNYLWTWLPGGEDVFREIDPERFRSSGLNPLEVLEAAAPRRLREMAGNKAYVARVNDLAARLAAHLERQPALGAIPADHPVAYFCSEYGVHGSLQLYGGGLGVLAGDTLKTASDLALPFVGVGLFYRQGYFRQRLDTNGWQQEYWVATELRSLPAVLITGADGRPITVELPLRGRTVRIQVWRSDIGRVPLYLLDTDREDNHPIDRWITGRLYVGDRQTRLAQYAVLGIGGIRILDALGLHPSVTHLNEGHAAFGCLERLRQRVSEGEDFDSALAALRQATVFTTHTPVAAGNEAYDPDEVGTVLGDWLETVGPIHDRILSLGRMNPDHGHDPIGITPLALRCSRASNGVSERHGKVARGMWKDLWPDRAETNVPIGHVTNGVHAPTWMARPMRELLDQHFGASWLTRLNDPLLWARLEELPSAELWRTRCTLRKALVDLVRERSIRDRLSRGEHADYVEAASRVVAPNALTIGFARRVAAYKRLYLLTRFPDRALRLLHDEERPIQYVIAGKAHPQDHEAKEVLRNAIQFKQTAGVPHRVVFLEDYDLHVAPLIMSGVDLWLNMPRPPLEASGTSGMKVVLNGGLNLSARDGWWEEAHDGHNGWTIATPEAGHAEQDEHDAQQLFDLLENEVIPLFYDRDADGIPQLWMDKVKRSMSTLIPRFNSERMLHEYANTMYSGHRPDFARAEDPLGITDQFRIERPADSMPTASMS